MSEGSQCQETIFFSGFEYFSSLIEDIKSAEQNIDLETYIFAEDEIGDAIADALIDASKRGVVVRILVDGAGSPHWGSNITKRLEAAGVKTRIFHPFPWRFWQWSRAKINAPFLLKTIYLILKINSRNHRKTCFIDNKIAYIGSFNICKNHLSREKHGDGWRDTGVRLNGTELNTLAEAFIAAWDFMPVPERIKAFFKHVHSNPVIRLNNMRHRRRILYKNLLARMGQCKERIWITNAYFIPDNFLLKKLVHAAENGVDVKILLPKKSDVLFMPWATSNFYGKLLNAGVKIFEYLPSFLHAKTLILDNWMLIGSTNLNHRSLLHDLEVDVNIRDQSSKDALEAQFQKDLTTAKEMLIENWRKRPLWQRFLGRLIVYLKYWI
jgi:cardiolipin synthase